MNAKVKKKKAYVTIFSYGVLEEKFISISKGLYS